MAWLRLLAPMPPRACAVMLGALVGALLLRSGSSRGEEGGQG